MAAVRPSPDTMMVMAMETKIQINGLKLRGYHGVGPQEMRVGNIFSYDIELSVPWLEAGKTDNLNLTLSYADIVMVVRRINDEPSLLIENVAYRLRAALVEACPQISAGSIRVAKLTPPIAGAEMSSAAVVMRW